MCVGVGGGWAGVGGVQCEMNKTGKLCKFTTFELFNNPITRLYHIAPPVLSSSLVGVVIESTMLKIFPPDVIMIYYYLYYSNTPSDRKSSLYSINNSSIHKDLFAVYIYIMMMLWYMHHFSLINVFTKYLPNWISTKHKVLSFISF